MSRKASRRQGLGQRIVSMLRNPQFFRITVKVLRLVELLARIFDKLT